MNNLLKIIGPILIVIGLLILFGILIYALWVLMGTIMALVFFAVLCVITGGILMDF